MSKAEITLSPYLIAEIVNSIPEGSEDAEELVRLLVNEIVDRAQVFINRFFDSYFLYEEPVHEFTGLKSRDPETGLTVKEVKYRLVIHSNHVGVFSVNELPLDDMYDVRTIIAESQLPEFAVP